jgi:predicted flap endonuclease-1-like 5' DNA nuclease
MHLAPPEASLKEENGWLAARLREMAERLREQGANPYRSAAYDHAAQNVAHWPQALRTVFAQKGRDGLKEIPGVGAGISSALAELIVTGSWAQLERLKTDVPSHPVSFSVDPEMHIPDVPTLLAVDREFRAGVAAGTLAKPPVLHTTRGEWHFTALWSHVAGHTHDWVVVHFYDGDREQRQCTVVTETRGPLKGKRVVRGREDEARTIGKSGTSTDFPPAERNRDLTPI